MPNLYRDIFTLWYFFTDSVDTKSFWGKCSNEKQHSVLSRNPYTFVHQPDIIVWMQCHAVVTYFTYWHLGSNIVDLSKQSNIFLSWLNLINITLIPNSFFILTPSTCSLLALNVFFYISGYFIYIYFL